MIKKILLIFIILISSFSYYGKVNENGEKVNNIQTEMENQTNKIQENEKIGQIQSNIIEKKDEIREDVIQSDVAEKEEIAPSSQEVVVSEENNEKVITATPKPTKVPTPTNTPTPVSTDNAQMTTKTEKKEEQKQVEKEEVKVSTPVPTATPTPTQTTKTEQSSNVATQQNNSFSACKENKHLIETGNSNKWFSSEKDAINYYDNLIKDLGEKWEKNEITKETYLKKCPYGYEVWDCPICNKWTINFYYR